MKINNVQVEMARPKYIPEWLHKYYLSHSFRWKIDFVDDEDKKRTKSKTTKLSKPEVES